MQRANGTINFGIINLGRHFRVKREMRSVHALRERGAIGSQVILIVVRLPKEQMNSPATSDDVYEITKAFN